MKPDAQLDERFKKAANVWDHVSWPLTCMGMWPVNVTTRGRIKLTIYLTYWIIKLSLAIIELFMVLGSLDTVIKNFLVTGAQSVGVSRVMTWRFSPMIRNVIDEVGRFREYVNFKDSMEMEIFIEYCQSSKKFHRFVLVPMCGAALVWQFTPLLTYLSAGMNNETILLEPPYRFPPIIDMSRGHVAIIVYISDFPLMFADICGVTTYSTHFMLINEIRAQLAILAHRVRNLKPDQSTNFNKAVGHIIDMHVKMIRIAKNLNDSTTIYLMIELVNATIVIGLCSYNLMKNLENTFFFGFVNSAMYLITVVIIIFMDCYMGECLQTEAMNLFYAWRECDIHNWPKSSQKALIICTLRTHVPMEMTAGNFFKFTLAGFISILRSSLAYISMLRALL